ncbi:DUF1254 domain-containing protein [Bradyrhizobium sp. USDA 10063]
MNPNRREAIAALAAASAAPTVTLGQRSTAAAQDRPLTSRGDGRFALRGGYPSRESVPALYEELDYQRAVQAYIWAMPAVQVEVLADGLERDLGLSLTTVGIFENFLDSTTVVATGNGESIYSFGTIDMSKTGPVVIEAAPGVLGFIISLWQQPLEDIGALGPDKGKGGKFLILPPGDKQEPPAGYFAVRSDTQLFLWLVRGFVRDGKPDAAVADIKRMRIYSLADAAGPPAMRFVNVSGKKATLIPVGETLDGLAYFEKIARFVEREPVREQDKQFLGMLAGLGIEKGKPFAPDDRTKAILARAAQAGHAMTAAISYDSRYPSKLRWPGTSNWEEVLLSEHPEFVNPNFVELDSRAALYYQALGSSKAALLDMVGAGSKYVSTFKDRDGNWLDGSAGYRLTVPPNPPVKDFWSVVVYDAETRSMIDTDQRVSGRNSYQQLNTNADGSIDLYFGPSAPAGNEANWVKSKPGSGFFLYFRWYGPLQPYFDKTWRLPDVEKVG